MKHRLSLEVSAVILLAGITAGCDKLGFGSKPAGPDGAPSEQELQKISYMSATESGVKGRRVYGHLEEAKTCGDLELALRWNRPPNVEGGAFFKKMTYLTATVPADLPKDSEVFIRAKIETGDTLSAGGMTWSLRMPDGTRVQAIEMGSFLEKQEQAAQEGKFVAIVKPNKPGRAFCAQGVYQGVAGKHPDEEKKIPLVSVLFAMDRDK